jgi:Aminotransferase class I and II
VVLCCQVGAKLVPVQLQPPNWDVPCAALEAAFSERTKFILVNTPHNPTGKVSVNTAAPPPCLHGRCYSVLSGGEQSHHSSQKKSSEDL